MREEAVFTFFDTHHAIGGERALLAGGVAVRVMSRPSALGQGCGICLRVDAADKEKAAAVLHGNGVEIDAVYLKTRGDGGTVYQRLASGGSEA